MLNEEYIYVYTRAQAIEDGVLISIDEETTSSFGFKLPVALTNAVYEKYVYWNESDNHRQTYQDLSGRLTDVLCMCSMYLSSAVRHGIQNTGAGLLFPVSVIPRKENSKARCPKKVVLKVIVGPGDDLEPVITILLPSED